MITAIDKVTALVLIDLQKGIAGSLPPEALGPLLRNAKKLMNAFRDAGLPVVMVHVDLASFAKAKPTRKDEPARAAGSIPTEAMEFLPQLEVAASDLKILKHSWGAFFETELDAELKKRHVTGIVLGGVSTSIGVEGTARQAMDLGYNITFASDAMLDRAPESQERSLKYIFPRMGETGDTGAILKMLGESAKAGAVS